MGVKIEPDSTTSDDKMAPRLSCLLVYISLFNSAISKSIPDTLTGKSCKGKDFCENPKDYPSELILTLLKNTTIPQGLFDEVPSNNRSANLLNMITKDLINIIAKEESDTEEISNFIDDRKPSSEQIVTTTEFVDDSQNNGTILF